MIEDSFLENENEDFGEQLLEDFVILDRLGVGAFSKVYKVEYQNEIYALKVVDKYSGASSLDKLYQEAQILNSLEHPNIVQYYKTIESKRKIYFLIECIDGQSLTNILKTKQLQENEIIEIIQQIINAVAYIHKKGIIHRDLKPDNILIDQQFNVKIIDFGLSFRTVKSTTHENCGTLIFMAPEALMKREYFKSVDIWSIGIIQYMMFSNTHPFWIDDTKETFLQKMKTPQQTKYPENMSKVAISFFEKTAAWEPEARITAEQALIHPWITGCLTTSIMTSKEFIMAYRGQSQFLHLVKLIFFLQFIIKYSQSHQIQQDASILIKQLKQSQSTNALNTLNLPLTLQPYQRTPSTQKLKTDQPPLSSHRHTQSRFQNNSSFFSVQENGDLKSKKGSLKLPPINTKSANNSPQSNKSQVFTFSPYRKQQGQGQEIKKSQFKC